MRPCAEICTRCEGGPALEAGEPHVIDEQWAAFVKSPMVGRKLAIMIKIKFIRKLALTLAAGCLSVGMLGVYASAQTLRALVTVVIGDNTVENMSLGGAAKLLVSDVCGVDERDAKEILELAAMNNQKIVAICPRTGAVFHVVP